jgi:hypothetical protein
MKTMTLSLLALCLSITTLHAQWEKSSGLTAQGIHALAVDHSSQGTLYAGTDRGVYVTTNNGESWMMKNNGLSYADVWSITVKDGLLLAGGFDLSAGRLSQADIYLSVDGGKRWTSAANGLTSRGAGALAPCALGFLAATSAGIFRTTDNGASWALAPTASSKDFMCLAAGPSGIFAGSHFDGPYRSLDDGLTWQKMDVGKKCANIAGIACSDSTIYVAAWTMKEIRDEGKLRGMGAESALFRSTDAGDRWEEVPVLAGAIINGIYATGDTLLALFVSRDPAQGGMSVSTVSKHSEWGERQSCKIETHSYPAGYGTAAYPGSGDDPAGIHISIDRGRTWIKVNDGLPVTSIKTLALRDGYVFAGTYIAGLFRRPMSELVAAAKAGRK